MEEKDVRRILVDMTEVNDTAVMLFHALGTKYANSAAIETNRSKSCLAQFILFGENTQHQILLTNVEIFIRMVLRRFMHLNS